MGWSLCIWRKCRACFICQIFFAVGCHLLTRGVTIDRKIFTVKIICVLRFCVRKIFCCSAVLQCSMSMYTCFNLLCVFSMLQRPNKTILMANISQSMVSNTARQLFRYFCLVFFFNTRIIYMLKIHMYKMVWGWWSECYHCLFFLTCDTPWSNLWGMASCGCVLGSPFPQNPQHFAPHCAASPGLPGFLPSCTGTMQGCKKPVETKIGRYY